MATGPFSIAYNPSKPAGERLSPEVREEIAEIAPSTVTNGSITTAKLEEGAVTQSKIAPEAVGSEQIEVGAVHSLGLAADAVTTLKIVDDAVTPPKCGTGVVTARDSANNAIEWAEVLITAADYAALAVKDPNVVYNVTA